MSKPVTPPGLPGGVDLPAPPVTVRKARVKVEQHPDHRPESGFPRRPKTRGPYRGEFGAIHHESHPGFLFTVAPVQFAPDVADALNVVSRLEAEAKGGPPQRFDTRTFSALEAGPKGHTYHVIVQHDADNRRLPVLKVTGAGNPDVFAAHVAGCLNLNANYTAALLPVVRLLLDLSRPAEVRRALWAELRRIVAHYDAVTGKDYSA